MGFLAGYSKYADLTLAGASYPGGGLSGATTGVPTTIAIPAALKAVCQAAGEDLRLTAGDGTTLLPYGIENWAAAEPIVHVLTPLAAGNVSIRAYGGNAGASDAQSKATLTAALAGYWPLGDAASPAVDWCAAGNNMAQSGGVTFGGSGQVGGACSFAAASNQYLMATASPVAGSPSALTVACWVNGAAQDNRVFIALGSTLSDANFILLGSGTSGSGHRRDSARILIHDSVRGVVADAAYGICLNSAWHHVALAYSGSACRVYIDGADVGGVASLPALTWTFNRSAIGVLYRSAPYAVTYFTGSIDGALIAGSALSANQIKALATYPGHASQAWGAVQDVPSGHPVMRRWGGISGMTPGGVRIGRGW